MTGAVNKKMIEGIENTRVMIVFITRDYMNKVNKHGDDNCKYEFRYAREKLGSNNLIPVVMETEMKNQKFEWKLL